MSDLVSNKHINTSGDDCGAEAERCVPRQNTLAHKVVIRFKKKKGTSDEQHRGQHSLQQPGENLDFELF